MNGDSILIDELMRRIARYLTAEQLATLCLVSKAWHETFRRLVRHEVKDNFFRSLSPMRSADVASNALVCIRAYLLLGKTNGLNCDELCIGFLS